MSAEEAACAPPGPASWDWPRDVEQLPEDAPLQALLLTATKLMGAYGQCTVQAAGLKVSLAGLGVLRVLMDEDGLKSSEVADRAWSSPGTVTAVVNTLARDGFVERKPDEADRRMSTSMACEGAQMAIDAWEMREKFIRKMEALGRRE